MNLRQSLPLLILIVLVAFGLRVYELGAQEMWGDESVSVGARRLTEVQTLLGKADVHPPLYFFTLREAMLPFGASMFAARFVSAFWGVLVVPLVYRIGKRALGERTGLLAALVCAASALQVFYSQEARMYTMATAWAAASLWCTVELLRQPPLCPPRRAGRMKGEAWWVAFVLTALVGMYSHYFVAFVVMAEGLALLWAALLAARRDRRMLIQLAIATAAVSLLYAPWIPIQRSYAMTQAYTRWELLTPAVLVDVARQTLISWSVVKYNVIASKPFPGADWGTVVVTAVALVGAWAALRPRRIEAALVPLTALVVIGLGWAINPILPVFQDRYLMIGTPAYLVLVGAGLAQISDFRFRISVHRPPTSDLRLAPSDLRTRAGQVALVIGIVTVLAPQAVALNAWFNDPTFVKGEYGKAMAFVSARAQPGDVLLLNNYIQWGLFDYYRPANVPAQLVPTEALGSDATTDAALGPLVAGKARAWLVDFGYAAQYDPDHRAEGWLAQHGYKQLSQDFIGVRASLYTLGAQPNEDTPAQRVDARLGNSIALAGYTLDSDTVKRGESVRLTLYWRATDQVTARYTVFTHVVDANGQVVAQTDSQPLGGTSPTDAWQVGVTVVDRYAIPLKPDAPAGSYELRVGMYTWPDLARLLVTLNGQPAGDDVPLATVRVTP